MPEVSERIKWTLKLLREAHDQIEALLEEVESATERIPPRAEGRRKAALKGPAPAAQRPR